MAEQVLDAGGLPAEGVVALDVADGRSVLAGRWEGRLHAYLNVCPHQGAPLDGGTGRVLFKRGHLFCMFHSATFDFATGACIWGPCLGRGLEPVDIREEGGKLMLHWRDEEDGR